MKKLIYKGMSSPYFMLIFFTILFTVLLSSCHYDRPTDSTIQKELKDATVKKIQFITNKPGEYQITSFVKGKECAKLKKGDMIQVVKMPNIGYYVMADDRIAQGQPVLYLAVVSE